MGSFGRWLTKQREVRNLTLREVSDATKIGMRYLEALEGDRFEVLPATIFAKGFLRNYAQYVGLDADEVVNYFLVADRERRAEEEDEDALTPVSTRERSPFPVVVAVAVVVAILLVLFFTLRGGPEVEESPPIAEPAVSGPAENREFRMAAETPPPKTEAPVPLAEAVRAPLLVVLSFTGDCWVEARVDGRRQVSELRVQGESVRYEAEESVSLVLGDVGAVRVEVNGELHPVAPGETGRVEATFDVADFEAPEEGGEVSPASASQYIPATIRVETGRPSVVIGAIE